MRITRTSPVSGITRTLDINISPEEFESFRDGKNVQDAMPRLTDDEREFLLTGITPDEWDKLWLEDDDA